MVTTPLDSAVDLETLARRLTFEGMPPQAVVALEAGVSQPTVSRAMRSQIKTVTRSVRKLWSYTEKRLDVLRAAPMPPSENSPRTAEAPQLAEPKTTVRKRARPLPRVRPDAISYSSEEVGGELATAALEGLRDYLADKFDPKLVIEQLAVLRRAQDSARRRGS